MCRNCSLSGSDDPLNKSAAVLIFLSANFCAFPESVSTQSFLVVYISLEKNTDATLGESSASKCLFIVCVSSLAVVSLPLYCCARLTAVLSLLLYVSVSL